MKFTAGVLLFAMALAGCGKAADPTAQVPSTTAASGPTRFADARDACGIGSQVSVDDGGRTVTVSGIGKDEKGASLRMEQTDCLLEKLNVSSAVKKHMETTRALDGQQTDEWDGIKARWTYHPDDGLNLILQDTQ